MRCYCEGQLEQVCILGPPDLPNTSPESPTSTGSEGTEGGDPFQKAEGFVSTCSPHNEKAAAATATQKHSTGLLNLENEVRDFFSVDGEVRPGKFSHEPLRVMNFS